MCHGRNIQLGLTHWQDTVSITVVGLLVLRERDHRNMSVIRRRLLKVIRTNLLLLSQREGACCTCPS